MEMPFTKSVEEVIRHFGVDVDYGYTEEQVDEAQEKYGPNGKFF